MSNLRINGLLYNWLKEIRSHDGILILISVTCLITPLDSGKWQYTAFRVDIKDIVSKHLNNLGLFSVLTMLVSVFHLFSFSISIHS